MNIICPLPKKKEKRTANKSQTPDGYKYSNSEIMLCVWASQVVLVVKNPPASAGDIRDLDTFPRSRRSWRRKWQLTPVFVPGESQGQRQPGGLQSIGSQSQTRLKQLSTHAL